MVESKKDYRERETQNDTIQASFFFLIHEKGSRSSTTKTQNGTGNLFNSICKMGITHRIAVKNKRDVIILGTAQKHNSD